MTTQECIAWSIGGVVCFIITTGTVWAVWPRRAEEVRFPRPPDGRCPECHGPLYERRFFRGWKCRNRREWPLTPGRCGWKGAIAEEWEKKKPVDPPVEFKYRRLYGKMDIPLDAFQAMNDPLATVSGDLLRQHNMMQMPDYSAMSQQERDKTLTSLASAGLISQQTFRQPLSGDGTGLLKKPNGA